MTHRCKENSFSLVGMFSFSACCFRLLTFCYDLTVHSLKKLRLGPELLIQRLHILSLLLKRFLLLQNLGCTLLDFTLQRDLLSMNPIDAFSYQEKSYTTGNKHTECFKPPSQPERWVDNDFN